ncbi:MAG: ABC transporter substrate-binding protein [Candidatus Rokubacteria bacterium]|nr:ABC transporter substrate-binding protein [Candidatus Rokubacteria bacterium]
MRIRTLSRVLTVAALVLGLSGALTAALADHEIVAGGQCDRTGATKLVGEQICPGVLDYVNLVNKKGGIEGHRIRYIEVEHGYQVDRGVEAYERIKREGGVAMLDYGTPIVYALTPRHMEDKIPGITPGFGRADATDGRKWPYIFPLAATYWSQMGAGMKYVKDSGARKGSKIAYIFYDNPAGREPLHVFERICKQEGYGCRTFAVPPPGVEMASQVLDITRRMRADWVIAHLFGKSPSISIKEFKKNGFPLDKVVSLVWGAGEHDILAAGWDTAQGYLGMQFAGVGRNFPVIQEIVKMYRDEGREVPATVGSVYYNRGVLVGALMAEAIRLAVAHEGLPVTGEKVRNGYRRIRDFTLGGLLPPLTVTEADHEGGGWVKLYQVRGTEIVAHTDWFHGYRDVVQDEVRKAAGKK